MAGGPRRARQVLEFDWRAAMKPSPSSRGPERPLTPESSMRVSRPAHRAVSVLCVSIALVACSGGLSAQSPQTQIPRHRRRRSRRRPRRRRAWRVCCALCRTSRPSSRSTVRRSSTWRWSRSRRQSDGGVPGLSPNDPFFDFFRRFGIPGPDQQAPRGKPAAGARRGLRLHRQQLMVTFSPTPTSWPTPMR